MVRNELEGSQRSFVALFFSSRACKVLGVVHRAKFKHPYDPWFVV